MGKLFELIPFPDISFARVTNSKYFLKVAETAFQKSDLDGDGKLDFKELYIALLRLYDKLNAKLPCRVKPPKKDKILEYMKSYDIDHNQALDFPEFLKLSKILFIDEKDWKESILIKATTAVLLKTAVFPGVAYGIKAGLIAIGIQSAERLPLSALAPVLDLTTKFLIAKVSD